MGGGMSRWWLSRGALAAASVLLGVLASAAVNLLTSGNSEVPVVAGAAIVVISLVALETWRARRSSRDSDSPPHAGKPRDVVRGNVEADEVAGYISAVRTDRAIGTIEGSTRVGRVADGGEAIGVDIYADRLGR